MGNSMSVNVLNKNNFTVPNLRCVINYVQFKRRYSSRRNLGIINYNGVHKIINNDIGSLINVPTTKSFG